MKIMIYLKNEVNEKIENEENGYFLWRINIENLDKIRYVFPLFNNNFVNKI